MGPKNVPKKGGEDVDLSDIGTLPKANSSIFQVAFSKFKSAEVRQKVLDHVTKSFSEERVKTLTRQEIIEFGKGKGIIEDGVTAESARTPDQLTYQQMLGQSAADRLFELQFAIRKAKKEKQVRLEEEAAAKAAENPGTPEKPETDDDLVDALIMMPDYPTTQKEHLAFSQYGHSINCFYEVYQVQDEEGAAPADLKAAKEVAISEDESEKAHFDKFMEQMSALKSAISISARNAPMRHCAVFRVPFCDAELVEFKQNEEGEPTTNTLTSEQSFMNTFLTNYLEKFGAYYVSYIKFRDQVDLHQLMPDKGVMAELKELKRAHVQYEQWRADREASKRELEEQKLNEAQAEGMSNEEKEEFELQKNESVKNLEDEMDTQKEEDLKNQEKVKELLRLAMNSIDEEEGRENRFSDKVYKADFIPDKESSNSVSALMSAMVSQIAVENAHELSQAEVSTEPETLDDIFDSFRREVSYDTNLAEREPEEQAFQFMAPKGVLQTEFNAYETYDTSTKAIQTLPAGIIDQSKDHARKIAEREKQAARNLVLPGCNRFMMPDVASKSLRLRNFENPQFYPFSTLPIEDAERTMQLKAFQQVIKSNGIDEGVKPEKRLAKNKIFERKFDEYFEADIFRQVMQDALLYEPDIASMYYQRTDQLLLVLHNKINNSKRSSENKEKPHGLQDWRSAYRVMPDFQSWIEFFGHDSVVKQEGYEPKDPADPLVKYTMDEEMIPSQMLDIDDQGVKNISQTLNQFFPDDNSIITSEEYEIGGVKRIKSNVYKDKLSFGFKSLRTEGHIPLPKQEGLVSYKPVGEHQFWLNFADRDTKMLIETVEAVRNTRGLVEVKPPEPTAEEIAAKEAEKAAAAAAAAKNKKGKDVVEEVVEKEPEPVFEEGPPNFLDDLFKDDADINAASKGPGVTLTVKNGLIVRHMPNGDVVQIKDTSLEDPKPNTEIDRVHLQGGIVIRHFHNLNVEVLWPNGDFAQFKRDELKWTVTNDKGFRREYKDGVCKDLPKINCLKQTDTKTGVVTQVREDNVVLIKYEDGNLYCQHADGTQIFSQDDGAQTRVEKQGFAPVMYQATEPGEDLEEWLECDELKSLDNVMTMVYLPDGCVVKTIKFWKNSDDTSENAKTVIKHIYQRQDLSCFMIDEDGDFRIISTEARAAINDDDERAGLGRDSGYLKQHYIPNGTYDPGVYYGRICDEKENVHLAVRDSERAFFYKVNHLNKLEKHAYDKFQENEDWRPSADNKGYDQERDIERIGIQRNPYVRSFIFPRVFVISPNGEGIELLSPDQTDNIASQVKYREDALRTARVEYVENTQMQSIQYMNKVTSIQETQLSNEKMAKLSFPEYAWPYIIPRRTEEEIKAMKPIQDQYLFRNIAEYSEFTPMKQDSFMEDYMRFNEWKLSQLRYNSEFGITHVAPKDGSIDIEQFKEDIELDEFYAKRIILKICNERALLKEPFGRGVFKENFARAFNTSDDIVGFRRKMTTVQQEQEEIRAELEKKKKQDLQRQIEYEQSQKEEALANWREKKKYKTATKVEERLNEYKEKKETPTFANQYHKSRAGQEYFKHNPVKPPSDEVLMRMTQRINRSQQNTEKAASMFDGNSQKSARSGLQDKQQNEDKDNPIVALEPEDHLKQASVERSKKFSSVSKHSREEDLEPLEPPMSLYFQEKVYLKQLEQEKILKAEEHHVIKTKDFDVYGKLRPEKPFVKSTAKSNIQSELNEKFITTECITDRRVKISSMANRQYNNAPSVEEVRKQGQHQMILQAINKKQTFSELINQANSMVTSVLHDSLKRSVNIMPSAAKFGIICQGEDAEIIVTVKNEDSLSQRIQIKPTQDKRLVVRQETYGPIAPGMTKKLIITVRASMPDAGTLGKLREEVQVMTKSDVYKVPVDCQILTQEEFDKQNQESFAQTGKNITNSRVRNRLRASISQGHQSVIQTFKAEQQAAQELNVGEQQQHNASKNEVEAVQEDSEYRDELM